MKWILRVAIALIALSSGLHALAMPVFGAMGQSVMGMEVSSNSHMPNSCIAQCVASTHDFGTALASVRIPQLLPLVLLFVSLITFVLLAVRLAKGGLSYVARPPDLITLYAHYRI